MPETVKSKKLSFSPFITRIDAPQKSDFDKYYFDAEYKQVYKKAGIDSDGEEFGVIETKVVVHKRDIAEFINSQADTVGVESYMKALAIKGVSADDFFTNVDLDKVQDFTDAPTNKFDGVLYGKKAVEIFNNLDPALKGNHTTIEGFLGSLTKDSVDAYIRSKVDAVLGVEKVVKKEGD